MLGARRARVGARMPKKKEALDATNLRMPRGSCSYTPASLVKNQQGRPRSWRIHQIFGGTYGEILDFSFGGRTENRYEMALDLFSGAGL